MKAGKTRRDPTVRVFSRRPLPEVSRRLRGAFPELWTRYRLLETSRDSDELRVPPSSTRNRPARPS